VLLRETWGDGIYLVFDEVEAAARCALGLQRTFASFDLEELGLAQLRGLRVGAHVGPVLAGWDPITRRARFSGRHVTTTARIEPRTPEGDVYATQQFAAVAMVDAPGVVDCQYVGRVPSAKGFGDLPMYLLTQR
jgi:class 3 adenylate cyclase